MAIFQPSVHYDDGYYQITLLLYGAAAVLGTILGLAFMSYSLIKSNQLYLLVSFFYFIIGVGSGAYLEHKTKKEETNHKPEY